MDFQRLLLFLALSFVVLLLWQAWQEDYGPKAPPVASQPEQRTDADVPSASSPADQPATPEKPAASRMESGERITVETDVLRVEIDTVGGNLRRADLVEYPVSLDKPDDPVTILSDSEGRFFIAQSGLLPAQGTPAGSAPDHHARYRSEDTEYRLRQGEDELEVKLTWQSDTGIEVDKVFTFRRGDYLVDVRFDVRNGGAGAWSGHPYRQLQRTPPKESSGAFGVYTYTGGVIYTQETKYEKVDFDDMAERDLDLGAVGGWAAMMQHYFLTAWIPAQDVEQQFYSKSLNANRYLLGFYGTEFTVPEGEHGSTSAQFYVGPKLPDRLSAIAPGLELTVDYGILTVIAKPIYWLLDKIHALVGNWGWSIVLLTVLIKALFYKPSEISYRSMAHMRKMQPRMMSIKEKFGDDRQKMNEAMMRLYKEEKINPLNGCLPILIQIPVFIALYWVLLESVELRQAPFILWIKDLSTADPYFVLPVIMGLSMIVQHRLNPTPMDPIQAKVMMILPVVFTVFFAFFPAGLVLYWVVNNVLSITQQWYITRRVVAA